MTTALHTAAGIWVPRNFQLVHCRPDCGVPLTPSPRALTSDPELHGAKQISVRCGAGRGSHGEQGQGGCITTRVTGRRRRVEAHDRSGRAAHTQGSEGGGVPRGCTGCRGVGRTAGPLCHGPSTHGAWAPPAGARKAAAGRRRDRVYRAAGRCRVCTAISALPPPPPPPPPSPRGGGGRASRARAAPGPGTRAGASLRRLEPSRHGPPVHRARQVAQA